jgi:hypothetical protein
MHDMRRRPDSLLPFLQQDTGGGGGTDSDSNPDEHAHGGGEQPESTGQQEQVQPFAQFPDEKAFNKRMDREARSRLDKQAQDLGYDNHQAMLDAAKAYREAQAEQQSEAEKEKARADAAEQRMRDALQTADKRLIRAEVKALCRDPEINIVDEDAAYALMDHTEVEVDDTGNVQGVKESLQKLVQAKPWLVVTNEQPRAVPESPRPAGQRSKQQLVQENIEKLRRSGMYGI